MNNSTCWSRGVNPGMEELNPGMEEVVSYKNKNICKRQPRNGGTLIREWGLIEVTTKNIYKH